MKQISERLAGAGFALVDDGIRVQWVPDAAAEEKCVRYGESFAKAMAK